MIDTMQVIDKQMQDTKSLTRFLYLIKAMQIMADTEEANDHS